jgi:hypothetical protein
MRLQGSAGASGLAFQCVREAISLLNQSFLRPLQRIGSLQLWAGNLSPSQILVFFSADSATTKAAGPQLLGLPGIGVSSTLIRPEHADWEMGSDSSPRATMQSSLYEWFVLASCPAYATNMHSAYIRTASVFSLSRDILAPSPSFDTPCESFECAKDSLCSGFTDIEPWLGLTGTAGT